MRRTGVVPRDGAPGDGPRRVSSGSADVVIVGAGPAGSSLATWLARQGVRVVLLDERLFPRSKPCGDCLSPGATPLLEGLGVLWELREKAVRLRGWRLRTPGGRWFEGRFGADTGAERYGLALPRRELDAALLRAAARAGAEVREGVRVVDLAWRDDRVAGVRVRRPDGHEDTIGARLVAGADGLRSTVARRMGGVRRGRRPRLGLVARYADGPPPTAEAPFGEMRLSAEGCAGLAPVGSGRWNVTVVVPVSEAQAISTARAGFLEGRLRWYGLAERLAGARRVGDIEVTGPFEVVPRHTARPGALLVGDAAGYFDPFTGQGIYRALATGRLAAAHGLAALEARSRAEELAAGRRYARALEALVAPSRRVQRLIDFVVGRPALIDGAAALLAWRPGLADLLVRVTGDLTPAAALLSPGRVAAALADRAPRCPSERRPRPHRLESRDAHA